MHMIPNEQSGMENVKSIKLIRFRVWNNKFIAYKQSGLVKSRSYLKNN